MVTLRLQPGIIIIEEKCKYVQVKSGIMDLHSILKANIQYFLVTYDKECFLVSYSKEHY